MSDTYPAIVATEDAPARLRQLSDDNLPEGDVTVDVSFSSLNYKDGLAVTGKGRIVRRFPMVCGVDLAGMVDASTAPQWRPGDEVVCTGWGLSETHPGGYTGRQRLHSSWLVARPDGLSLRQSMAVGTAGLTSMLCILALEHQGLDPAVDGEVLVTGAGGGVGCIAVAILSRLGYRVAASTGRADTHDFLRSLGARTIVDRSDLSSASGRPLDRQRWAAAVDCVTQSTATAQRWRSRGRPEADGSSDRSTMVRAPSERRKSYVSAVRSRRPPGSPAGRGWRRRCSPPRRPPR